MCVLVIGGTGFIGEYLCRTLAEAGEKVIAVGQQLPIKKEGIEYSEINLDINFSELRGLMGEVAVVVFALQPDSRRMQNILSVIQEFGNVRKIVYLSTLLVYPDAPFPQAENVMSDPLTDYEIAKDREEEQLSEFIQKNDVKLCIARLANVYGGRKNKGVIHYLFKTILEGVAFTLHGDGSQVRDCIFIEDVVELLAKLISLGQAKRKEIVNVSTGVGLSILQLINLVEDTTGKKMNVNEVAPLKEKHSIIGDNHKLVNLVGHFSLVNATAGVKKTYELYSQK